jgi:hypothetical protein
MRRLTCLLVLLLPATVPAQVAPASVVSRGVGVGGLAMSDGEPISFFLEHAQELDLTEAQRTALFDIRRKLRVGNGPFMKQLDSLREFVGLSLEQKSRGMTIEDRNKLQRFEQLAQPVADSIKVYNDAANRQARALLDSVQVVRLDSIAVRERETIDGRRPPASPPLH